MRYSFDVRLDGKAVPAAASSYGCAAIFGAGIAGIATARALEAKGKKVICFVDNDRRKQGTRLLGYPVLSAQDLAREHRGVKVLIAAVFLDAIGQQLSGLGMNDYVDCYDPLAEGLELDPQDYPLSIGDVVYSLDLNLQKMFIRRHAGRLIARSLDVVLTEKCTLRCRDCANLMQFYADPRDCDSDEMLNAIGHFMANVDFLFEFRVLGGEPLVYRPLSKVLERLVAYPHVGKVVIFTNGTLLPKRDVLQVAKDAKVTFRISDYGEISGKRAELVELLQREGIAHFVDRIDAWHDCARFAWRNRSAQATEALFANCCTSDTLTLLHGKLHRCPFSAHGENLQAIPSYVSDRIDLSSREDGSLGLREALRAFIDDKKSIEACSWCGGRDYRTRNAPVAVQAPKPVAYEKQERRAQ